MTLEAAVALIAELQTQNALLREQVAVLGARITELEAGPRPPPWVKVNRPARVPGTPRSRRQRRAEENHGRPRGEPTACVQHAYDHCPDCGYPLRGQAVARRREVLELPEVPVAAVEHQFLKR